MTIYAKDLDQATLDQYQKAIDQPYVVSSALMADAHLGYTMPIGGVVATKDYIVPSWVGYDIGCGVLAATLDIEPDLIEANGTEIYKEVLRRVPVGFNHRKHRLANDHEWTSQLSGCGIGIWYDKGGTKQMGTLGGGNHFIEIGYDSRTMKTYVIIHSGSRGIGHGIASHYIREAHPKRKLAEGSYAIKDTSYLGERYLQDLKVCTTFAFDNRLTILRDVVDAISHVTQVTTKADLGSLINRTHNHVKRKDGLWIHRKGATHAEKGMMGVIPGNMRDGSYIVKGLGDLKSLYSASHGAGRKYGRKAAKRELDADKFSRDMENIVCNSSERKLDEAPDAYKDIVGVMSNQLDLVEIVALVRPIINIKG